MPDIKAPAILNIREGDEKYLGLERILKNLE